MKISTRTRYGVRAALELAKNWQKGPVKLKNIAKRQELSVKYLEQLMAVLKTAGIIHSIRGAKGGYILAKAPAVITVYDVFRALEGDIVAVDCLEDRRVCHKTADCVTRELWADVRKAVDNVLQSTTLQDLVDRAGDKKGPDYQI